MSASAARSCRCVLLSAGRLAQRLTLPRQVKRELNTRAVNVVDGGGRPWETVTITTLSRDRALLGALLEEARDYAVRENEGKLVVYTAWNVDWQPHGQPRRKRPLRSVVLADGVAETIERDIRTFLERRQWYADRGEPCVSLAVTARTNAPQASRTGVAYFCTGPQALARRRSSRRLQARSDTTSAS
jgi:hypothetical protein